MSHDENDAPRAATFLNAQIRALWEKATEYTAPRFSRFSRDLSYLYCIALAKYSSGSRNIQPSSSPAERPRLELQLGAPTIDFVCRHVAILELDVIKAQFTLEPPRHPHLAHLANRSVEEISNTRIAFRMAFEMSDVTVEEEGSKRPAKRFDLDYPNAKLVQISPPVERGREALEAYLQGYLSFLHDGGHDTLFCPVAFYHDDYLAHIDFSRASRTPQSTTAVHTVPVEEINRFLCTSWLMASTMPRLQAGKPVDRTALSLAEYRSKCVFGGKDAHFGLVFSPPEVVAICDSEVIVYFDIAEALFYKTGDFESHPFKVFCDWKVAMLMDIDREQGADSNIVTYHVNRLNSHFMPQFSQFPDCLESDQEAIQCRDRITDFISGEYLSVLEKAGYLVVLHHDLRLKKPENRPSEDSYRPPAVPPKSKDSSHTTTPAGKTRPTPNTTTWQDVSQDVGMSGFDQVIALPQAAINDRLHSQWVQSQAGVTNDRFLATWQHKELFHSTFGPIDLRLTGDGKAILRVRLIKGSLKPVRGRAFHSRNAEAFQFSDWLVAYTVDLKLCDHAALPGVNAEWRSDFAESHSLGGGNDVNFKHLYVDLQHAEFNLECSSFKDLCIANDKRSIDKAQAVVVYLRDHYFKQLTSAGHHVLSTIPIWKSSPHTPSRSLTSVTFYVDSDQSSHDIAGETSHASEPVIFIVGMFDGQSLPNPIPDRWGTWIANNPSPSLGTLALSADSFLFARLLPIVSEVNAMTRIEPTFSEIQGSQWKLYLTSWNNHNKRVAGDCRFVPTPPDVTDGPLQFHWRYGRKFSAGRNESHSVFCRTENYLELPTASSSGPLELALHGSVYLELVVNNWSSKAHAYWKTTLQVSFENDKFCVTTATFPTEFTRTESMGAPYAPNPLDPRELLRKALPETMELKGLEQGLQSLESARQTCHSGQAGCHLINPVFNRNGDLLFQISPHSSLPSSTPSDPLPVSDPCKVIEHSEPEPWSPISEPRESSKHSELSESLSSVAPVRQTYEEKPFTGNASLAAHRRRALTAGVQSHQRVEDDSPDNSPVSDLFSPTRTDAKRDSIHYRCMDELDELDTPATEISPSPTTAKHHSNRPSLSISTSSSDGASVATLHSYAMQTSTPEDPTPVPQRAAPLPTQSAQPIPPSSTSTASYSARSTHTVSPHAAATGGSTIPERDMSSSSRPSQNAGAATPALHIPPTETPTRPSSVGGLLFRTGTKDTQTIPSTLTGTDNSTRDTTTRPSGAPTTIGTSTTRQTPLAPASAHSPAVTPLSRGNAANLHAQQAATPVATHSSNAQNADPSLVYPHLLPQRNSLFDSNRPLQPGTEPVLDPTTAAGRRALREKLKGAVAPPVPGANYDHLAGEHAIGVGFKANLVDLAPRREPSPKPPRALSVTEQKRQLAAAASILNRPRY